MKQAKTILITGASSGIGRAAALALARGGHTVIAAARRRGALDALRDEAPAGKIIPLTLDINDGASIEEAVREVDRLTDSRGVEVLINNAGYATAGALAELSDEALRAQFETNVFGLMRLTRAVLPGMFARKKGRLVNVSSVSGRIPAPMLGAYHASKYALEALSDALRMELHPFGIQVVLVEPGTIRTEFAQRTLSEAESSRIKESRYAPVYARTAELEARFAAMAHGPESVVRAIETAVSSSRPRARYVAPWRFFAAIVLVRLLPTCWVDALMRHVAGLTRAALCAE